MNVGCSPPLGPSLLQAGWTSTLPNHRLSQPDPFQPSPPPAVLSNPLPSTEAPAVQLMEMENALVCNCIRPCGQDGRCLPRHVQGQHTEKSICQLVQEQRALGLVNLGITRQ